MNKLVRYREVSKQVTALQWTAEEHQAVLLKQWLGDGLVSVVSKNPLTVTVWVGRLHVQLRVGQWIVKPDGQMPLVLNEHLFADHYEELGL